MFFSECRASWLPKFRACSLACLHKYAHWARNAGKVYGRAKKGDPGVRGKEATLHNLQYSRDFSLRCQLIWICLCSLSPGVFLGRGYKYIWDCWVRQVDGNRGGNRVGSSPLCMPGSHSVGQCQGNKTFRKVKLNKFYNIIYAIKTCTPLAPTTTALVCLKYIYKHIYPACILGPAVAPICPRPPTAFFGTVESAEL